MSPSHAAPAQAEVRSARRTIITGTLMGVGFAPVARVLRDRPMADGRPVHDAEAGAPPGAAAPPAVPGVDAARAPAARTPGSAAARAASPGSSDKHAALTALRARYEAESPLVREMPGWTNIVFGDGDPDAELMFIGEAPGADEDASGIPFVGRAGQKLNEMIIAMGLTRESVYIANVLKVRPPNNRTPTPQEAQQDGPFLVEQVRIIRPRAIVTLGRPAAMFMLNTAASMGEMRGTWQSFEGIPVMPTYHPAFLLRAYTAENRRKVWSDLKQVMDRLRGG